MLPFAQVAVIEPVVVLLPLDVAGVASPCRADLILDEPVVIRKTDVRIVPDEDAVHPPANNSIAGTIAALVFQVPLETVPLAESHPAAADVRDQPGGALFRPLRINTQFVRPAIGSVHRHVDAGVLDLQELNLVD